jgi:multidrug efflux system membrane fusion protein
MTSLRPLALTALTLCAACLVACEKPKPAAQAPSPPPKVTVARPIVRDVTQWDEYSGRIEAVETVEVKAQVSGFVDSVRFTEGALVKKGDLLLTIDSHIFQAQLDSANAALLQAQAKLELAQATLQLAQNDLARAEAAGKGGGMSPEEIDTRRFTVSQDQAAVNESQAAIKVAEAAVKSAAQYVDWCKVTAPISGRISDKRITTGNMLNGGAGQNTTVITTIKSVDPVYCYVQVDEASVLKYQRLARENKRVSAADAPIPCYMELDNESNFPHTGTIDFVDNSIDPATGTRRARGVFPNPDGTILPGSHARFRVEGQVYHGALLVIDDAIGLDQDRKFLYVLHPDNSVERRTIATGPLVGELRVVLTGLRSDELVLVNGVMNLAFLPPGGHVDPTTAPMPEQRIAAAPPPAAAAAPDSAPAPAAPATSQAARSEVAR